MEKSYYNFEFKEYFLKEAVKADFVSSKQAKQYKGIFTKTHDTELRRKKDLYDFTYRELDELLMDLGYKTIHAARRDISLINKYVKWSIESGQSTNQQYRYISGDRENANKYVYKMMVGLYTKDQIYNALNDKAKIFQLMLKCFFEGIGSKDYEELQLLKVDMLEKKGHYYFANLERRELEISEELYNELIAFNNVTSEKEFSKRYKDSEYIFKPYNRKGNEHELFVHSSVRNFLWKFLKENLNDKRITSTSLLASSANYYAYYEMKKSGEMVLTKDVLKMISERFPSFIVNNSTSYGKIFDSLDLDFIRNNYGEFKVSENLQSYIL